MPVDKADIGSLKYGVDAQRRYVIEPAHRDVFVRTGKQIIEACEQQVRVESLLHEMATLAERVHAFCLQQSNLISKCLLVSSFTSARLSVAFITASGVFDFDLSPKLAELEFDLQSQFPLLSRLEVTVVPGAYIERFIAPKTSSEIYPEMAEWLTQEINIAL